MKSIPPRTESLILFARPPIPGRVKTRLVPALGADGAASLYRAFLADAAEMAAAIRKARPSAGLTAEWAMPDDSHAPHPLPSWLPGPFLHRAQSGHDLGARMAAALGRRIAHGGPAVLVGTDIPGLPTEIVLEAFDALARLEENSPGSRPARCAVLGPARDGGYYLIGLNRLEAGIFSGLEWGSERVFEMQSRILAEKGYRIHTLSEWRDVDTPGDLNALRARLAESPPDTALSTRAALESLQPRPG
jgi:rSAM/selenodomain-associated transferase 1